MCDRRQMEDRIIFNRSVETGVIAERSFRPHFARLHVTFEDEIDIGRNFEIDGLARNKLDRFLSEKSGEKNFVQAIGQGAVAAKV